MIGTIGRDYRKRQIVYLCNCVDYFAACFVDDLNFRMSILVGNNTARPSGIVANQNTHSEIQIVDKTGGEIINTVTKVHNLPLSIIAPYRTDHPLMQQITPF